MNLLEDIQNDAIDASSDLGSMLRKCKVLAARLNSIEFDDWIVCESNGYPDNVTIPEYRIWSLIVKGNFLGPFSSLNDHIIPIAMLPEEVQDHYNAYEFKMSIGSVESLILKNEGEMVIISTNDLALSLGSSILRNMNCLQCWAEFSTIYLDELLNAVRQRILDFTLAIQKEHPNAGEINSNTSDLISHDKIMQIFNTTIYGGNTNLTGTAINSPITFTIQSNDFESLCQVLRNQDISEEDLSELHSALSSDRPPKSSGKFGPKVSSWIAKMTQKAADGSWNIAIGAAANLLATAISQYYGF